MIHDEIESFDQQLNIRFNIEKFQNNFSTYDKNKFGRESYLDVHVLILAADVDVLILSNELYEYDDTAIVEESVDHGCTVRRVFLKRKANFENKTKSFFFIVLLSIFLLFEHQSMMSSTKFIKIIVIRTWRMWIWFIINIIFNLTPFRN